LIDYSCTRSVMLNQLPRLLQMLIDKAEDWFEMMVSGHGESSSGDFRELDDWMIGYWMTG
jgi:hypothetical protein